MALTRREARMSIMETFEQQIKNAETPSPVNAADWLGIEPHEPDQIVVNTFDVGDKVAIIGGSKLRKTFFLLQLLLSLAAGRGFLAWRITKPRRVFHVQFEIQANHYHRRVRHMAHALRMGPTDLEDRLQILNARGMGLSGIEGIKKIEEIAKSYRPEIISIDPLYKIATGAENNAEDVKTILNAFDELAETTGASIIYVHHDAKGTSGDREIRDRGAGSNVLGRDYDAGITLTPHAYERDAAVVETLLRNYRSQEPFTAIWTEDDDTGGMRFYFDSSITPTKKTSATRKATNEQALDSYLPAALDLLKDGPMSITVFMDSLRLRTGLTHERSKAFRNWATGWPHPALDTDSKRGRGRNEKVIGTSDQILRLRGENEKKK